MIMKYQAQTLRQELLQTSSAALKTVSIKANKISIKTTKILMKQQIQEEIITKSLMQIITNYIKIILRPIQLSHLRKDQ